MSYNVTGTAGNDTLNQAVDIGPGTIVGLDGTDLISTGIGAVTVDGGSGEDTVIFQAGNTGQVTGGTENDSIWDQDANSHQGRDQGRRQRLSCLGLQSRKAVPGGSAGARSHPRAGVGRPVLFQPQLPRALRHERCAHRGGEQRDRDAPLSQR
jgi:hypothetical protein